MSRAGGRAGDRVGQGPGQGQGRMTNVQGREWGRRELSSGPADRRQCSVWCSGPWEEFASSFSPGNT